MAKELIRVLDYGGTLNFKWSDRDIPSEEVLKLFPIEQLYGQEGAHGASSKTNWFTFCEVANTGRGSNLSLWRFWLNEFYLSQDWLS